MAALTKVETYFSSVASAYQTASDKILWRMVREREARAVLQAIGDVAGRDVLELGCGAGFYTRLLLERGARHVHAVDLSRQMLDQLPAGAVTAWQGDATTIDPGRRFPVLLSAGMLEFVPDPLAVLRHAAQLACPDGAFTILYPTDTFLGRAYRRFHRRHGAVDHVVRPAKRGAIGGADGLAPRVDRFSRSLQCVLAPRTKGSCVT